MATERIAVSMSKNDFAYLNYIRQGALYSGKSVSLLSEIGDILKAILFHTNVRVIGAWEHGGRDILVKFYSENNDENALKKLPTTYQEFTLYSKEFETREVLNELINIVKKENKPESFLVEKKFEKFDHQTENIPDNGLTNYILTVKEHERPMIIFLKHVIHMFSDRNYSNSEIIRFLLRYYFIYPKNPDNELKMEQFMMLSWIYIYGLYGYNPIESTLLAHEVSSFGDFEVDKEKMDMFKKIYYDKTLFDIYIKEIKSIMDEKNHNNGKKIQRKIKIDALFDDINENEKLNQKYRSMASGFSFHSSFIGYTLLLMEWFFSQHNLPILMTYLYAKNNNGISMGNIYFQVALQHFESEFTRIFDNSKNYNEDEKFLYHIHIPKM